MTYRDRKVGLNPGEAWFGSFRHRTRRTTWRASYTEDTLTQQQTQLEEGGFTFGAVDPLTGDTNSNPQPGDLVVLVPTGPITSLTNEVEERKRASGSVGVRAGKTSLLFTVFSVNRRFLTSLTEEDTNGYSASIDRRVAPRTNAILSGSWQHIESDRGNGDSDFWYIDALLRRQISPKLEAIAGYSFTRQDSERVRNSYDENRIEVRITAFF